MGPCQLSRSVSGPSSQPRVRGRRCGEGGERVTAEQRGGGTRGKRREEAGGEERKREGGRTGSASWPEFSGPNPTRVWRMETTASFWGSGRTRRWTAKANLRARALGLKEGLGWKKGGGREDEITPLFSCFYFCFCLCVFSTERKRESAASLAWGAPNI